MIKYYKLEYPNGTAQIVTARNDLDLVRKYDLATAQHLKTRIIPYDHDQLSAVTEALRLVVEGKNI